MTYPATWFILSEDRVNHASASAEEKMPISQETAGITKELAPSATRVLHLMKVHGDVSGILSITINVTSIPEKEWSDVDLDAWLQERIAEARSVTSQEVTANGFPLPDYPAIHNYSLRIPILDTTITQYVYVYWHPPYIVEIMFIGSHSDEEHLREIITSMTIVTSKKSTGGDVQ